VNSLKQCTTFVASLTCEWCSGFSCCLCRLAVCTGRDALKEKLARPSKFSRWTGNV